MCCKAFFVLSWPKTGHVSDFVSDMLSLSDSAKSRIGTTAACRAEARDTLKSAAQHGLATDFKDGSGFTPSPFNSTKDLP